METKKKALGKGLEQLFTNNVIDFDNFEKEIVTENKNDVTMIKLDDIRSNPYQPRKTFNEESLKELAVSIKEYGVVQPVIVKKSIKGYELIAGERRCKASRLAGLTEVPAIIKEFTDQEMMEIALIENIQREDLNPIDEAKSVLNIIKLRGWTQEEFATKFGKSRSYITNLIGLLKLPDNIQIMLINKELSTSHARVLSKLEDANQIDELAEKIVRENMNVRDLEELVSNGNVVKRKPIIVQSKEPKFHIYESIISDKIGNKVKINKNKIEITFDSVKDLERIMEIFNISIGDE
ncbi:MAG: ParB/RepB/Spo0J family partition protein [Bacilli bacterium]|nr:ParB/RepB/Spo0J family partition protein [Bacilli bacterium]MBQ7031257.1 ParB/RepB/Spo0J family partition protein [Bacilli bacterium]